MKKKKKKKKKKEEEEEEISNQRKYRCHLNFIIIYTNQRCRFRFFTLRGNLLLFPIDTHPSIHPSDTNKQTNKQETKT